MRWFASTAVMLAGCVQLLALDPAQDESVDADHDGVLDRADNCKGVANPDQADSDGDGVGDACDPLSCPPGEGPSINRDVDGDGIDDGCDACLRGPPDDEDGDGVADACDDCPGIADRQQIDSDGDGIGDACDLGAAKNRRVLFDGFGTGDHGWVDPTWVIAGGTLSPSMALGMSLDNTVVSAVDDSSWYVLVGIDLPAMPGSADGITIELIDVLHNGFACALTYDSAADGFDLSISREVMPFTAPPVAPLGSHVTLRVSGKASELYCEVLETGETAMFMRSSSLPLRVRLRDTPDIPVTFVEVVQ